MKKKSPWKLKIGSKIESKLKSWKIKLRKSPRGKAKTKREKKDK